MLEARFRDVRRKGKTLRNEGLITGTIKRKNGEICAISMIGHKVETYVLRNGLGTKFEINLENEEIKGRIDRVQKDLLKHNIINIDIIEI